MIIIIYCIKISLPQYRYSGKLNVCLLVMEKSTTTNSLPLILMKCQCNLRTPPKRLL